MTELDAQIATARGVSAVCARCDHYWEGRARNLPGDSCTSIDNCASPLRGGCFHEYKGAITNFTSLCFVCGVVPKIGIRVGVLLRPIGVCDKHVGWVKKAEEDLRGGRKPLTIIGQSSVPEKKSIIDAMIETEQEWAEEDEKNGIHSK